MRTVEFVGVDEKDITAVTACDSLAFTVAQSDYDFGTLQQGHGYVQFCLFGGDGVYTASQTFIGVKS